MICIPAAGRTRSSLVAGIFVACGAWCGEDRYAHTGKYRTYENEAIVGDLFRRFPKRTKHPTELTIHAPGYRKLIEHVVPDGRIAVLKYDYYFAPIIRAACPDANFYCVKRGSYPRKRDNYESYLLMMRKEKNWINSDHILLRDFTTIRPLVEANGLVWNQEAVESIFHN